MAQCFMAGMTNYSEQTVEDIKDDILKWIEKSKQIKTYFNEIISELKTTGYWEKVPYGFAIFCEDVPRICVTFCHDFNIIIKAINSDNITKREIALMKNIYEQARKNEELSWKTYKDKNDGYWKDYGNEEFKKVETLYSRGRDFFVMLKDISNAVARMEDYMKPKSTVINNIEDKSIHIGDNNQINKSPIGNTTTNKTQKESFFKKYMREIIAGIIVTIIATVICTWLGFK